MMDSPPSAPSEPQPTPSPDTPSSISSDHTFHGFSPLQQANCSPPLSPLTSVATPPPADPVLVPLPAQVSAKRLVRDAADADTTVVGEAAGTRPRRREMEVQAGVLRQARREKVALRAGFGLRLCEFVVCLVSFSVMAADKNRGWALDSSDRYVEFRYSMSVNIICFAYSALQAIGLIYQKMTGKYLVHSQLRYYYDFGMDQMLAYLQLSASSSAFTRVDDWISNWGKDKFPAMASASVGVSFVAFAAFALNSLISGYLLCTHRFI